MIGIYFSPLFAFFTLLSLKTTPQSGFFFRLLLILAFSTLSSFLLLIMTSKNSVANDSDVSCVIVCLAIPILCFSLLEHSLFIVCFPATSTRSRCIKSSGGETLLVSSLFSEPGFVLVREGKLSSKKFIDADNHLALSPRGRYLLTSNNHLPSDRTRFKTLASIYSIAEDRCT